MRSATIEGIVENGQIRLLENVRLPENTRVYVVIAESNASRPPLIHSPRLAHPEQAADFVKQVFEEPPDAGI
jgi:predicted DNA-binding antitoxin AbrB/MazE fold protein